MTTNDLDTWQVIYGVNDNTELEVGIGFAFNNHEAQTRKTVTSND